MWGKAQEAGNGKTKVRGEMQLLGEEQRIGDGHRDGGSIRVRWEENVCKDSEGLKEKRKILQVLFLITPGSTPMFHMGNSDV